jgi:alpha-glucosidase
MRPVFLEYPEVVAKGDRLGGTESQFMLGRDLLVAPPPTGESPARYAIPLPSAGWYDYWTGRRIEADQTADTPELDRLPVFVRPGAILPRQPLVQSTAETPKGALEIAVYPGANCRGAIYLDDGVSFAFRRGEYLRQTVRFEAHGLTFDAREGRYRPWWNAISVVIHGWSGAVPQVRLGGRAIPARVDAAAQTLTFELPDLPRAATVSIESGSPPPSRPFPTG